MQVGRRRYRQAPLAVGLGCAVLLAASSVPQDERAVVGYRSWQFGMRHFQVAHVEQFGPYLPVQSTGGLETHNGVFEGEQARIAFVFGEHGLETVQIRVYEGGDVEAMAAALYRAYRHLSERYGDLATAGETFAAGLGIDELLARIPAEYKRTFARIDSSSGGRGSNRRTPSRRIELAPIRQPHGAHVGVKLTRAPALGTTQVMVSYSRVGNAAAATVAVPDGALEGISGPVELVDTTTFMQAPTFGIDEYDRRGGDVALLTEYADLRDHPHARFFRLALGTSRATMAVVGNFSSGFELRAIPPAVPEPAELRFARDGARYVLTTELTARQEAGRDPASYAVPLRLAMNLQDGRERVRIYALGMRRGTVQMGGRELAFGITGDFGIFNGWYDAAYFDLDGDGAFARSRNSSERVLGYEGYFTMDGVNWRFDIDRFGDRIWLTRLEDGAYPRRATLDEGAMAPDFSFVDLDGVQHRLSDYRGKLVLLDFWGAWCGPCRGEAPHLVEAYERYRDAGFEIIGIDYNDTEEAQAAFMEEYGMEWLQTRESELARPIHDLYRNWTWPTHYLIDENGRILDFNPRGSRVAELLEQHFGR